MIPVQQYTFQIPAGGAFPLQCTGRYFRIQSASGTLKVQGDDFGNMGLVGPGQGFRLREKDPTFLRLTFSDTSGAANNVTVLVADADFVDNTVPGQVSVVDGGYSRVLAGQAFSTLQSMTTTVAANNASVQLVNQLTTGKNVVIEQLAFSMSVAGSVRLYLTGIAIGVFQKNATNKLAVAAAGVGRINTFEQAGGWTGTAVQDIAADVAGKQVIFTPKTPLVLPPGSALTVADTVTTAVHTLTVSLEHVELPVV